MAENTGRSGQPVQKLGGRGGNGASALATAARCASMPASQALQRLGAPPVLAEKRHQSLRYRRRSVFAGLGQHILAVQLRIEVGPAQDLPDRLLQELGRALLHHQHRPLAGAEAHDLLGHQRVRDVEHVGRQGHVAMRVGKAGHGEPAVQHIEKPALHDDAELAILGPQRLVELVLDDELQRRRQPPLQLVGLLAEGGRRMRQPVVVERGGHRPARGRYRRGHVVAGRERAVDMAGAHAQLDHHRRVGGLRQLEALLHHLDDGRQLRARVQQPQRGFQGERVAALLDHAGALAVVLAEDDQRAAGHAGGSQVGQRIGGHVGADDRFPGHRPAHGIVDGGAQHGRGGGLVGAGLQVDAELGEQVLRLQQHVEQVADRRALVAADIGHTRLQQGLGDGQDALAAEFLAVAQPQAGDLFAEGDF